MKKMYFPLFICATLLLSACKKYTCECSFNFPGSSYLYDANDKEFSGSRKNAEDECDARVQHVQESNPQAINVKCDLVD